ncbi:MULTISPECIES: nitroreductase family protein [Clostridium]|uniref:nitroreductase family protein n=1 Tax=Clostridium TaxID=1485 RepID=UPI00069F69D2|nr:MULTISPECIES: nitroreductase family protein [Clostridium]KOF55950.1 nitroreductase [Clostridium sp. DMHC 10]MCD2345350.1 nitroreductase family protein [Clostridium guangxiense]
MDFYEVIKKRTSIKKFKNTPIPDGKLNNIINAAMMSPSWKNKTSYSFIIVDDEQKKNEIAECVLNDTGEAAEALKEAPIVAVVVGDPEDSGKINGKEYYLVDSAIAMEHFILAAANEGYGTCWIASLDENKVKTSLRIPEKYSVVAVTPVGEFAESKSHNEPKDLRDHVYKNYWSMDYSDKKHFAITR